MKNNITILVAVLCLALGFGGGYFFKNYQVGKMRSNFGGQFGDRQKNGQTPQVGFNGMAFGEVISQDEKSITIKMQDGSTKMVILGDSTIYSKTQSIDKSELSVGIQVRVFGNANSDGSVTAQNVQINPLGN
jgi:hypothetical protein